MLRVLKSLVAGFFVLQYFSQSLRIEEQINYCKCQTDQGVIDLSPLDNLGDESGSSLPMFYRVSAPGGLFTYSWNPCTGFVCKTKTAGDGAAVCKHLITSGVNLDVTYQKYALFYVNSTGKLHLNYTDSSNNFNSSISFKCSDVDHSSLKVQSEQDFEVNLILTSRHACFKYGQSFGDYLLIIFFVTSVLYLCLGAVFRYFYVGARNTEIIPNLRFWKDFPYLVKDGFCFTKSYFFERQAGYQKINVEE